MRRIQSFLLATFLLSGAVCGGESGAPTNEHSKVFDVQIESEPLGQALQDLARQTGVQLIFFSSITDGHRAPAVHGKYSIDAALRCLLDASQLTFRAINPDTIEIRNQQVVQLRPINHEWNAGTVPYADATDRSPTPDRSAPYRADAPSLQSAPGAGATQGVLDPDSGMLEEVMVTAEKRPESLRDTPISMSVLTADMLTTTQTVNFDQLSRHIPNLIIDDSLGSSFVSISNRGIRTPGSQAGFESSTAVVIDDVYEARPAALAMALSDVERIELLHGPQGALYGRNASAGVLNIVTNPSTSTDEFYVEAYGGSYAEGRVRAAASGPLADDIDARASVYYLRRDAFSEALFPGSGAQSIDRFGVGLRFDGHFGDWRANLILRYFAMDDDQNSQTNVYYATPALTQFDASIGKPLLTTNIFDRQNDQNFHGFDRLHNAEAVLHVNRDFGALSLESISAYGHYGEVGRLDGDDTSVSGVVIGTDELHDQASEELRLRAKWDSRLDALFGLYGFYENFHHSEPTILGSDWATYLFGEPALTGAVDNAYSHQLTHDLAPFIQTDWHLTDALTVKVGGRVDSEKKTYERTQPVSFLSPLLDVSLERSVNNWSGSVSALYAVTQDVNVYASVNRGVKSGGFNFSTTASVAAIPFSDEHALNYEVGVRSEWLEHRIRLNATVFDARFTDLQVYSFDGTEFRTQNAASARTTGVELEAVGIVRRGLEVGASLGYLEALYLRYPNAQCASTDPNAALPNCVQNLAGRPLVYAPRSSGTVYVEQSGALSESLRWHGRIDANYRSAYYLSSDLNPDSKQSGYVLTDISAGVELPASHWTVSAVASNAFNKRYLQAFYNYPLFLGAYTAQAGQPALIGVVVRKSF